MDKQPTNPISVPTIGQSGSSYTKTQHSSCLTKLYGISPDVKVSDETYLQWCRQQQHIIDDFVRNRRLTELIE